MKAGKRFFLVVRHKNIFAFVYRVEFFESSAANIAGRPKSKLKQEFHREYENSRELVRKIPSIRLRSSSACVFTVDDRDLMCMGLALHMI